jgi:hypothetical protein
MNVRTNMPGFTAEAAQCNSGGRYRSAAVPHGFAASHGVIPQLPIGFCMANCDYREQDPFLNSVCKLNCLGEGGGGSGPGGGGGPRCRPRCTRCSPDSQSETGRSRTCVSVDCDAETVPC